MSADLLQKVFRTLGDPTRARILLLLEREELAVQELMDVLEMAQSTVSRHLGILRDAGWVRDRRDGTFSLYRFSEPSEPAWSAAWSVAREALEDDPAAQRDAAALARVLGTRERRGRDFFESVGGEWDALRKVWGDELLRARAIGRLVPPGLRVADFGTGTGVFALELAAAGCDVIAIDSSETMLEATQRKLAALGVDRVEPRLAEPDAVPLSDGEVDAAFAHMVLQYVDAPAEAIAGLARGIRPGGRLVLIDFTEHERAWMQAELGVVHLGFAVDDVRSWLVDAGFVDVSVDVQPEATRGADLPPTFIAHARRPENES